MPFSAASSRAREKSCARCSIKRTLQSRWRRLLPLVVCVAVLGAAKVSLTGHLLVNFTPSIPRGVYWISPGVPPKRGALVAFPIPESVRDLVYERGYVPRSIRLLAKPVAAIGGDNVCTHDRQLVVNGELSGRVLEVDREGRRLPQYSVCGGLPPDVVFVSTEHDTSFDSRYFGPIELARVRGTLTPLWIPDGSTAD